MKPNKLIIGIAGCMLVGLLAGCGEKTEQKVEMPDPQTQPEAQAALFQRTCDRVKALIAQKSFDQARKSLEVFDTYKLTPEQQKIVDGLKAQIPAAN